MGFTGRTERRFVVGLGMCECHQLEPEDEDKRWMANDPQMRMWALQASQRDVEQDERRALGGRTVSEFDQAFRDPLEQPDGAARPSMLQSVLARLKGGFELPPRANLPRVANVTRELRRDLGLQGLDLLEYKHGIKEPVPAPSPGESFYAGLSRSLKSDPPLGPREAPSLLAGFPGSSCMKSGRRSTQGESLDVDGESIERSLNRVLTGRYGANPPAEEIRAGFESAVRVVNGGILTMGELLGSPFKSIWHGRGARTGYPVGARSVLLSPGRLERGRAANRARKAGAAVRPTVSRCIRPMRLGSRDRGAIDRWSMGKVPMGSYSDANLHAADFQ